MRTKEEIFNGEDEKIFMLKCSLDFSLFCERVLGYTIKPFHKEWCTLLRKENRLTISAPTGFGKTWIFGIAYPLWLSYFRPNSESLIISKSVKGQASSILEEIRYRIEHNELLRELLPSQGKVKSTWTKERIICSNNSKIFNAPYSTSVRGHHVDYIFGDEVASFMGKEDNYEIWFRDVLSRVADSKRGKVAAVSTPIDPTDLLNVLMNKRGYISKFYPAIVDDKGVALHSNYEKGISIWPERFPINKLMFLRDEQGPVRFERNYQCNPKAPIEKALFKPKDLADCHDHTKTFTTKQEGGIVFMGCDFAMTNNLHSDYDAYVIVEKIADVATIMHMEVHKGIPVESKINRIKQLCDLYKPYSVICDESNVGGHIVQELVKSGQSAEPQPFGPKSRNKLLTLLKIYVDNQKIVIPFSKEDPEAQKMADLVHSQLLGFREEKSEKTGMTTYVSRAPHDDLAMSLALAVKGADTQDLSPAYFASGS